ncbi:unnamed protein product [Caenorhabditis angaria]|uniref:Centriolar and ciliogenesis-associated protein HYLS1 C-terminal domain-containing protein n=1 Tax=Caenorhabditis angaria TaxID=860376 RepID=A0A9P1IXY2_9PELO|nr:unnamed protein product [Caenorhabditis angaria]
MSYNDYTDDEIEQVVNEMGLEIHDMDFLHKLRGEINKILDEDEAADDDTQMFGGLSIDNSPPSSKNQNNVVNSPIVSRNHRNLQYPNEEIPEQGNSEEANSLISQALNTIGRMYKTCRNAEAVTEAMRKSSDFLDEEVPEASQENDEVIEDEEEIYEDDFSEETPRKSPKKVKIVDPSFRPVLVRKPGRAPLKCDPVTRFHLYKEEWARHPAPGELRRLSLRWKVREYMLRHDVPRLHDGKAEHPKDWSPRPYID